jgi:hypothetical protein
MFNKKSWRAFSIIMLAVIMTIVVLLLMRRESRMCMGIEIVPEAQITNGRQEIVADIGDYILFEGEEIAYDRRSNTVYIPQVITENTRPKDMKGSLELSLGEYTLKFIFDEQMQDFQKAVKENYKFTVAAVNDEVYTKINVIFTTLPVITITTGDFIGEEEGREVYKAQFKMWAPYDKGTGAHSIKTGDIEYHYRGNTSYYSNKKSYKLTFTDGEGVKNNIELLGMGEDDDWILGSMIYDDLKIKLETAMGLDAEKQETVFDTTYNFSNGDYQSWQKFAMYNMVGDLDVTLMPKSVFEKYAPGNYFSTVSPYLSGSLYTDLAPYLLEIALKDDDGADIPDSKAVYGIDLSASWVYKNVQSEEPMILVINAAPKHAENIDDFLSFLFFPDDAK